MRHRTVLSDKLRGCYGAGLLGGLLVGTVAAPGYAAPVMGEAQFFERVFENAPDVQLLLDDTGKVLAASDAYLHAAGSERTQVIGRSVFELPPYATAPHSQEQLRIALAALHASGVLVPHALPDAAPCASGAHWVAATNLPIRDRQGRMICIRHALQSAPAGNRVGSDREHELRKLFENSYDAIGLVDLHGRFTFITPSIQRVLGYSEQEYIDAPPMALVHPEDAPGFGEAINKLFTRPGGLMLLRVRSRHRDGRFRTLECSCVNRLHDPDVAAVIVTFRDVTAHVELQEELRRSHEQLRVALSAAHAISCFWDVETKRAAYSDDVCAFFGMPAGSYDGLDVVAAVHPDDRAAVTREAERCLGTGAVFKAEFRGPEKGPATRWYAAHGQVSRNAEGTPIHVLGVTWDITEHKQRQHEHELLDRRVQDSQKLESLGVLAGGIAHDFNNILTAILGNASLVRSLLGKDADALEYVTQIEEGSRRAAELCRQMLAYAGKGRFILGAASLNHLIEETADLLRVSVSRKAELRLHLHPNLPATVADVTQIRQVLMNLVINASDAIGERSGTISISTGIVHADRSYLRETYLAPDIAEGDYLYLEVSDTGSGMSADTQARMFEPFFSTKFTGRGLGLAAMLGIVRGHKGALKVHSELGKGSTFRFLLPTSSTHPEPAPPSVHTDAPLAAHGKILLVDDEAAVREVTARMLERLGFQVTAASNGQEAVRLCAAHPKAFIAVLMDLTMPHLDGQETLRELRRLDPHIPVLLMSGYDEQDASARFVGDIPAGFIPKPFSLDDLREHLRVLLG